MAAGLSNQNVMVWKRSASSIAKKGESLKTSFSFDIYYIALIYVGYEFLCKQKSKLFLHLATISKFQNTQHCSANRRWAEW